MKKFSCVAIISKPVDDLKDPVTKVLDYVRKSGADVLLDANTVRQLGSPSSLKAASLNEITDKADVVIVVGGDGTMLGAARDLAHHDIAMIGINAGRLGFIPDITVEDIDELLPPMLDGHYCVDTRPMLEGTLLRGGKAVFSALATNDIGICHGRALGMVEYSLRVDNTELALQRADGIIVSTATGSTAYAMSAGGPIMHPALGAMLLVPIAPHTLSNRPILVPRTATVRIEVTETRSAVVSFDAQVFFDVVTGDVLKIGTCKDSHFILLHPENFNQYEMFSRKLNWSTLPKNDHPIHEKLH